MSILDDVTKLEEEALERIGQADSLDSLKELQIKYLGRKGPLVAILRGLGSLSADERRTTGAKANEARQRLEEAFKQATEKFAGFGQTESIDPTLPGTVSPIGTPHIVNQVMGETNCHDPYMAAYRQEVRKQE